MDTNLDVNKIAISAIRDVAVLARVSVSKWSGISVDKKRIQELKEKHGAVGDVGKFMKNTVAGADKELKEAHSKYDAVYTYHYRMTLPFSTGINRKDGPRLLANMHFQEYLVRMSQLNAAAEAARDVFIDAYPEIVKLAKSNLAGMADDIYPSPDEVRARFGVNMRFDPVPDTSFFPGVPSDWEPRMRQMLIARQNAMTTVATKEMWEKTREKISKMVTRIKDLMDNEEGTRFHTTTIENVRELLVLLPGWNVTGDARVDEVVNDIKTMLEGVNADKIKDMIGVREDTLVKAQSVMDKLNSWGV